MKTKTIATSLLVTFIVASCVPVAKAMPTEIVISTETVSPSITPSQAKTSIPSSTPTPKSTNTPATYLLAQESWSPSYPTCLVVSNTIYAVTAPAPTPDFHVNLPNGLILQEYHSFVGVIHPAERGCWYSFRDRVHAKEINLDNSYQIFITPFDDKDEMVLVVKNGKEIYKMKVHTFTFSGLVEAWGYQNHWVIEIATLDGIDIIQDGESLKSKNNYEEMCSFQILSGKPFYFFKKPGFGYGVNYAGVEIHLDYDEIPCNDENPNVDPVISRYQNMVDFFAKKDGNWTEVIIGTFDQ